LIWLAAEIEPLCPPVLDVDVSYVGGRLVHYLDMVRMDCIYMLLLGHRWNLVLEIHSLVLTAILLSGFKRNRNDLDGVTWILGVESRSRYGPNWYEMDGVGALAGLE
jgi:hypothetical protein